MYLRLHKGYYLPGKPKKKWSNTRAGPYKVVEQVHPQAFRLDFPAHSRVHPVVSAVHLWKPEQGPDLFRHIEPPPGPIVVDDDPRGDLWEIDRIITHKIRWYKKTPRIHFLVRSGRKPRSASSNSVPSC